MYRDLAAAQNQWGFQEDKPDEKATANGSPLVYVLLTSKWVDTPAKKELINHGTQIFG